MPRKFLDMKDPSIRSFSDALDKAVAEMERRGLEREALVLLAEKLQYKLATDACTRTLAYSQPLEVLMRVVIGLLDGAHHTESYIRGKLGVATGWLGLEVS